MTLNADLTEECCTGTKTKHDPGFGTATLIRDTSLQFSVADPG
jgi:hypothetical protein